MLRLPKIYTAALLTGLLLIPTSTATAAEGATISGKIKVFKTKVKTKGAKSYKDVVVYLEAAGGNKAPAPKKTVTVDQEGMVYIPHVVVIQKGDSVKFLNNDNEIHNVFSPDVVGEGGKKGMDLGNWGQGKSKTYTFTKAGAATILCKLHLEMAAYVVAVDTPYYVLATIDGDTQRATFSIKNVPPGKYTLNAWHKKLKLKGGARSIEVKAGANDSLTLQITKKKYAK